LVKHKPVAALFGGSFDPPHKGHQSIVQKVASLDDIDYVIVMPAFLNPFKTATLASAEKRLTWCKKVCRGEKVIVSNFEVSMHRPVYTIETLKALQDDYEIRYLVIGSDNLAKITEWQQFKQINARITWLVFTRDGADPDCHLLRSYKVIALQIPASSTAIRNNRGLDQLDDSILDEVAHTIHRTRRTTMTIKERVDAIISVLDDKKAEEIEVFDLADTDYIAKEVIIANSFGGKHTVSLYEHLKKELKPKGEIFLGAEESDDWVVVDLGDIIIHIMTPAYREHYSLETFLSGLKPSES